MTREELKNELRPHVNLTPLTSEERQAKLVPIAQRWLRSELDRGNDSHDDIFNTWNLVMVELVDERKKLQ